LEQGAAHWSCLTTIDKAQEEVIMLFANDLFSFLQMTCSAAQVIVTSSLSWVSVLSVDFAKQAAE